MDDQVEDEAVDAAKTADATDAGDVDAALSRRQGLAEDEARRAGEMYESVLRNAVAKEAFALPPPPAVVSQLPQPRKKTVLMLTFRDASGSRTYNVEFKTKPLGIDFVNNVKPARVDKVMCAAKRLGVQEGSDLLKIGSIDVEHMDFGEMFEILMEGIEPLQPSGLVILFRGQGGEPRTIIFPTKPLGMDFSKGRNPVRVFNVQGAAMSLGVRVDWEIINIAGKNVEEMEFDEMLQLLHIKISSLPAED